MNLAIVGIFFVVGYVVSKLCIDAYKARRAQRTEHKESGQ